jgi:hypothetical protein
MAYSTVSASTPTFFGTASATAQSTDHGQEWVPDLDPDDLLELQEAEHDPSKIVARLPSQEMRLGYFSTLLLIANRRIGTATTLQIVTKQPLMSFSRTGTGIFNSASVVFVNTQSIGASLLLWVYGAVFALSGVVMYIELGLTIPRWAFGRNGEKVSTPRSGDAMNYVYIFTPEKRRVFP